MKNPCGIGQHEAPAAKPSNHEPPHAEHALEVVSSVQPVPKHDGLLQRGWRPQNSSPVGLTVGLGVTCSRRRSASSQPLSYSPRLSYSGVPAHNTGLHATDSKSLNWMHTCSGFPASTS